MADAAIHQPAPAPPSAAQAQTQADRPAGGPDPNSKSAMKKEQKRLEKEAKLAAKAAKVNATATTGGATPTQGEKVSKAKEKRKEVDTAFVNTTPKGEKKDMSQPMAAGYDPIAVEAAWYDWWDAQGFFLPQTLPDGTPRPQGTFVIPAPPPNVTGNLHIGHALTTALQDTMIRWNRMLGKTTLFVPGFDHAGIATQSVVEKRLYKTQGKTRHDLGRERFLETVWAWKNDYQERITSQLKRLGGSYDWSRVAFTMNESLSKAVAETFCRLHEDGVLYRANRLVNWCVQLNTTLSNLEVDQKQLSGRTLLNVPGYDLKEKFEFGVITSFGYPIEGGKEGERIVVATTRPETMLGDTAIAVHPDDERYKHLHGKFALHPFVDRRIPIVTDSIAVDMAFGTGAVKITPAHDPNDYDVGKRHNLDFINIMHDDGTFNASAGPLFDGTKRFHARVKVIQLLKERGLYVETKDNPMQIPVCSRSGDVIEPILKAQWWVDCKPLAEEAIKRTRAGELVINPKTSEAEWYRWLEGIQDWCISRQLWWGHRCPAYFVNVEGESQDRNDGTHWVVGRTREQAEERARELAAGKKYTLEQDEDVLDTWFSSGLWPFSIMGWPTSTSDLKHYYPSSVLETGWDIIFFWVARMVLLGIKLTGEVPFKEVFCHAMVRDAHGRKMSKSLGNVIDPVDVIQGLPLEELHEKLLEGNLDEKEIAKAKAGQKKDFPKGIPQCGTDALRFALCAYTSGGRDINLEILRVEGYRKFCNKVFNATKFAMLKLDESFIPREEADPSGEESLVEKWIFHKLNEAAREVNRYLEERNFMLATNAVYNFWLYELCDVYIEAMKPMTDPSSPASVRRSAQNTLYICLDHGLRLLHPFMPFVTEELWQRLPRRAGDITPSIMVSQFPTYKEEFNFVQEEKQFELCFGVVRTARSLVAQYNIQSDVKLYLLSTNPTESPLYASQLSTLQPLIKSCSSLTLHTDPSTLPPGCGSATLTPTSTLSVLVLGQIDLEAEIAKCAKKMEVCRLSADKMRKAMAVEGYELKVEESVRRGNSEKMEGLEAEMRNLEASVEGFRQLKSQEDAS